MFVTSYYRTHQCSELHIIVLWIEIILSSGYGKKNQIVDLNNSFFVWYAGCCQISASSPSIDAKVIRSVDLSFFKEFLYWTLFLD